MPTHHLDDEREPKLKSAPFDGSSSIRRLAPTAGALLSWTNLSSGSERLEHSEPLLIFTRGGSVGPHTIAQRT
jgi:hypothetical protein